MESGSLRANNRLNSSLRENSSRIWRSTDNEVFRRSSRDEDDEEALKWANLEKLPTFDRLRRGLLVGSQGVQEVDVHDLGYEDKKKLVERLVNNVEHDNEKFLLKLRSRIDRVGIDIPTIEVRYEHLNIDAEAYKASRALPSFINFHINIVEGILNFLRILPSRKKPFTILKGASGIIKPCRMTLLLGPPSSGKTTLLLALAGRLDSDRFISVQEFAEAFQSSVVGQRLRDELAVPYDRSKNHPAALSAKKYGLGRKEIVRACAERELLLMKRNSFVYLFKLFQLTFLASINMAMFFRTRMHKDDISDGGIYTGALFFTVITIMFNGLVEVSLTIRKLPVFYKQRDMFFFPAWAYGLTRWIVNIPITFIEVGTWTGLTYYVIGLDPNAGRFLKQYLLLICVYQSASALFRFIASAGRNMVVAYTFGLSSLIMLFALGGFVLSRNDIKKWWLWGYWSSPLMYAQNAILANEFNGHSWSTLINGKKLGVIVMESRGFFPGAYWYWIGVGALIGFMFLFNICCLICLTYLNSFEKHQAVLPEEDEDAVKGGSVMKVMDQVGGRTSSMRTEAAR